MNPFVAKLSFVLMALGWYVIRFRYARRSRRTPVTRSARGIRENVLLTISLTGLGIVPFAYVLTAFPRFADYPFRPLQASLGILFALAAWILFYLTHRALGRYWSVSLEVRESHKLVTCGIYRNIRHPMYSAFWLWAVAQALLLPNWVAGLAGLLGFGALFFGRVGREERMMIESFGDQYRDYMKRTCRVIPGLY